MVLSCASIASTRLGDRSLGRKLAGIDAALEFGERDHGYSLPATTGTRSPLSVMPGLVPGIDVFSCFNTVKTWMAGTSPAMTFETVQAPQVQNELIAPSGWAKLCPRGDMDTKTTATTHLTDAAADRLAAADPFRQRRAAHVSFPRQSFRQRADGAGAAARSGAARRRCAPEPDLQRARRARRIVGGTENRRQPDRTG